MGLVRVPLSVSQFSELVGIDPDRFVGVEVPARRSGNVILVLEEEDVAQGSGVIPQLNQGGKKIGGKKKR